MALITGVSLPNDGDKVKVADYNDPINKLLTQVNGNLDDSNIASLSGTKIAAGTIPASALSTASQLSASQGWYPIAAIPSVSANNGQREHVLTFPGVDLTDRIHHGTRLRGTRSTAPATQSMSFSYVSSQYATRPSANVTNMTFTDDFTIEAWVRLTNWRAGSLVSRIGADSGYQLEIRDDASISLTGYNVGYGNSRGVRSQTSLPIGRWIHVAVTLDMSSYSTTTSKVIFDGVEQPAVMFQTGNNPAFFTQQGPFNIGSFNDGSNIANASLAEVRVWSTLRTTQQIRDFQNQAIAAGTPNLVVAIPGNGSFNDISGNGNTVTPVNGAGATNADSPFKPIDYGIVTVPPVFSGGNTTLTVFAPMNGALTNGGFSDFAYSNTKVPFGFPADASRWGVDVFTGTDRAVTSPAVGTWYNIAGLYMVVPSGAWDVGYTVSHGADRPATGRTDSYITLGSTSSNNLRQYQAGQGGGNNGIFSFATSTVSYPAFQTSSTVYYLNVATQTSGLGTFWVFAGTNVNTTPGTTHLFARLTYF